MDVKDQSLNTDPPPLPRMDFTPSAWSLAGDALIYFLVGCISVVMGTLLTGMAIIAMGRVLGGIVGVGFALVAGYLFVGSVLLLVLRRTARLRVGRQSVWIHLPLYRVRIPYEDIDRVVTDEYERCVYIYRKKHRLIMLNGLGEEFARRVNQGVRASLQRRKDQKGSMIFPP